MSQMPEQQPERKNRFSVSREAHEEYVTDMAVAMNKLADKIGAGDRPASINTPFCPTTGFAYGGASMTRLMLESVDKSYTDDRWLTFKQLQNYKFDSKNFKAKVKKGEHGIKLLRSEDVHFVVDKKGKWEFLDDAGAKALRKQGVEVQHKTLFYPYTVFNAAQLENFPPKENPAPAMSAEERNAAIDKFVACLGVKQEYGHEKAGYDGETDTIKLPDPEKFKSQDDYYAMKLRLAFHATGHNDRERREPDSFEVMRGETFSPCWPGRVSDCPCPLTAVPGPIHSRARKSGRQWKPRRTPPKCSPFSTSSAGAKSRKRNGFPKKKNGPP